MNIHTFYSDSPVVTVLLYLLFLFLLCWKSVTDLMNDISPLNIWKIHTTQMTFSCMPTVTLVRPDTPLVWCWDGTCVCLPGGLSVLCFQSVTGLATAFSLSALLRLCWPVTVPLASVVSFNMWHGYFGGFPHSSGDKESACNAGVPGSIPGSGRSPGGGHGNPLQYSCLENPMDREARQATVHEVTRVGHDLVTKPHGYFWSI